MELTNKYLSFFGIELNASKTTYTYANTDRHYEPIQIWNKHTGETAPSAVAAPTTALRYLGGWLSPSLRSRKGKRMLLAGIHSILNVLQFKKLDWREYRYVIQSVVASKALYYLNVAPFTDAELNAIDRRIAGQFKRTLKLARSTSSHICYLPEAERGFALPSIKQRRDALLIKQAYRCLNDPGHMGKILPLIFSKMANFSLPVNFVFFAMLLLKVSFSTSIQVSPSMGGETPPIVVITELRVKSPPQSHFTWLIPSRVKNPLLFHILCTPLQYPWETLGTATPSSKLSLVTLCLKTIHDTSIVFHWPWRPPSHLLLGPPVSFKLHGQCIKTLSEAILSSGNVSRNFSPSSVYLCPLIDYIYLCPLIVYLCPLMFRPTLLLHLGSATYASHHNSELNLCSSGLINAPSSNIATFSQITHPSFSLPLLFIPLFNRLHHTLAMCAQFAHNGNQTSQPTTHTTKDISLLNNTKNHTNLMPSVCIHTTLRPQIIRQRLALHDSFIQINTQNSVCHRGFCKLQTNLISAPEHILSTNQNTRNKLVIPKHPTVGNNINLPQQHHSSKLIMVRNATSSSSSPAPASTPISTRYILYQLNQCLMHNLVLHNPRR